MGAGRRAGVRWGAAKNGTAGDSKRDGKDKAPGRAGQGRASGNNNTKRMRATIYLYAV